ncbi:histidine kinase N-terminal 7TM domain-containing diguanylate cyclase [Cellulomonas cellasea]|uniref:GGDEF domain-containing protein n=1 Tax=Cellulomonas cellasea TaxID=43670 RepID=A0A4Y3L1X6_9CELL|nr:diguanylate cyclase [Cellulomonas cellasea]GEA89666.1 GGDEF domain-containing protein [Cellulomonas cellasea]
MNPVVHLLVYLAAAVVFVVVAVGAFRRRGPRTATATSLGVLAVAGAWWSLADAVSVGPFDERVQSVAALASFPGVAVAVGAFACLGRSATGTGWIPSRAVLAGLSVEPILVTVTAATNPWHQLFYSGTAAATLGDPVLWERAPLFWLHALYSYVLIATGLVLVARGWWTAPPAFRRQRWHLLLASVVPVLVNVVNLTGAFGDLGDPTPLGFAVTAGVIGNAMFRQDFIAFAPVARDVLIERISDPVLALSPDGRLIDANPAALKLLLATAGPRLGTQLIGMPASLVMSCWGLFDADGRLVAAEDEPAHLTLVVAGTAMDLEVRASPLVDGRGREIGTVLVARDVTEVNAQRARLVEQLATIERLRSDLAEQAVRDPLTDLHNRRHLMERFGPMLGEAAGAGEPLAVVVLDLDRFKRVNDEHGHLTGDAVLIAMAQRLRECVPTGALAARWGGEEFVVVVPGADLTEGAVLAETLRRRCEAEPLGSGERVVRCTLSAGVAAYPVSGETVADLLLAADRALYEAKDHGRNLVRRAVPGGAAEDAGRVRRRRRHDDDVADEAAPA